MDKRDEMIAAATQFWKEPENQDNNGFEMMADFTLKCLVKREAKIAAELQEVLGDFACDTVYDYTPTPSPCDSADPRHKWLIIIKKLESKESGD